MNAPCDILLAEDDESDVFLIERAFREVELPQRVSFVRDGQEAIELLAGFEAVPDDRLPALVILDMKMPRRSGVEVLRWIRAQRATRCIPVFMFSSSERREDIEQAYAAGANAFIVKPPSLDERREVARFIKQWLKLNRPPLAATEGSWAAESMQDRWSAEIAGGGTEAR
ncbi:MAG: response regulator [Opitutaceae bacterium]